MGAQAAMNNMQYHSQGMHNMQPNMQSRMDGLSKGQYQGMLNGQLG